METRKRKLCEYESSTFQLNELNQDLLEKVLSWLPTSSFLRLTSVCKKWKSVAQSATFGLACSNVPSRNPCFFMVDSHQTHLSHQPIIFDSSEKNWKKLNPLPFAKQSTDSSSNFISVAASGGLICFYNPIGEFKISNPVTGSTHWVESVDPVPQQPVQAIAMFSNYETFKLVLVSGELSNLKFKQYNATTNKWEQEIALTRKVSNRVESKSKSEPEPESETDEEDDQTTQYFLTKSGDVVSSNLQKIPCKQFSSLLTIKDDDDEILYFLSSSGTVVSCNLTQNFFFEYPRLLPVNFEYSIDIVEIEGQMYVVLLSEFFESASVRVWKWDEKEEYWSQIAVMPTWMSHKFYGKKVDINSSGAGKEMLVCFNSAEICSCFVFNLGRNEWIELPNCDVKGEEREFVCGFSFEPRIEASISRTKRTDQ